MTKIQETNDRRIPDLLEQGEEIIWAGRSESFPLKTNEMKKHLYIRWSICAVCIILWCIFFALFISSPDSSGFALTLGLVLVVLFFGYLALQPSLDRKKIIEKNSYYLTNHRAFVLDGGDKPYSVNLYDMSADFIPSDNGNITLLLHNNAFEKKRKNLRNIAWRPLDDQSADQVITDMAFYNVKDNDSLHVNLR